MKKNLYQHYFKDKKITVMGIGLLGRNIGDIKFLAEIVGSIDFEKYSTVPSNGSKNPAIQERKVDLPIPLEPFITSTSELPIDKFMSFKTSLLPRAKERWDTFNIKKAGYYNPLLSELLKN